MKYMVWPLNCSALSARKEAIMQNETEVVLIVDDEEEYIIPGVIYADLKAR